MKKDKMIPIFSYEKDEPSDKRAADKIMLKIAKKTISKIYKNI